ncbi:MAG: hypothetical protein GY796_20810 [Chloroflexi bacterium]|nr:hypothetical protein [Chloroflexota bacterium]
MPQFHKSPTMGVTNGQSKTIGVLTPFISSPFYAETMQGIISGLIGSGYFALFSEALWNLEREKQAIQNLIARRIDGLIMVGGESPPESLQEINNQVPLIVIGRSVTNLTERCLQIDDAIAFQIMILNLVLY